MISFCICASSLCVCELCFKCKSVIITRNPNITVIATLTGTCWVVLREVLCLKLFIYKNELCICVVNKTWKAVKWHCGRYSPQGDSMWCTQWPLAFAKLGSAGLKPRALAVGVLHSCSPWRLSGIKARLSGIKAAPGGESGMGSRRKKAWRKERRLWLGLTNLDSDLA